MELFVNKSFMIYSGLVHKNTAAKKERDAGMTSLRFDWFTDYFLSVSFAAELLTLPLVFLTTQRYR